jgi:hypothetical protein
MPVRVAQPAPDDLPQGQARRGRRVSGSQGGAKRRLTLTMDQFANASRESRGARRGATAARALQDGTPTLTRSKPANVVSADGWQNAQLCTAATAVRPRPRAEHNGRVGVRSLRPRLSLGVTLPGRYQPRPRLSTRYRLDQPWGAHRRLGRVSVSGTADGGQITRRNPCSSHGRPPSGLPGTEGTVLICPCAARLAAGDCLMGVQLGFMGVQLGGKVIGAGAVGSSGRLPPRRPEEGAS